MANEKAFAARPVRIGERKAEAAPTVVQTTAPAAVPGLHNAADDTLAQMRAVIAEMTALKAELAVAKAAPKAGKAPAVAFDPTVDSAAWNGPGWTVDVRAGVATIQVDLKAEGHATQRGNRSWSIRSSHGALWLNCALVCTADGMPMQGRKRTEPTV